MVADNTRLLPVTLFTIWNKKMSRIILEMILVANLYYMFIVQNSLYDKWEKSIEKN